MSKTISVSITSSKKFQWECSKLAAMVLLTRWLVMLYTIYLEKYVSTYVAFLSYHYKTCYLPWPIDSVIKTSKTITKALFITFSNNIIYSASQKVSRDGFVKTSQIDAIYDVSQPSQNCPKPIQSSPDSMLVTKNMS